MPMRVEDQPWYPRWHASIDRIIAAQVARDATALDTPAREAAQRTCDEALASFREIANQIR
jgi:hypothetical protein